MSFTLDTADISKKYDISISRITRLRQSGKLAGTWKKVGGKFHFDAELFKQALDTNVSPRHRAAARKIKQKKQNAKDTPLPPSAPPQLPITSTAEIKAQKKTIKEAGIKIVSLAEAQEIKANYDAALKKIEYEEKKGELISKEIVDADFFAVARRFRDAVLNIPDRVGAELASITDVNVLTDRLREEITKTLTELSR